MASVAVALAAESLAARALRPAARPAALLDVRGISVRFGGIVALSDVSFAVEEGAIVGLIGPNGAGKTTLFNVVSRLYRPSAGTVRFAGRALLDLPRHAIAGAGIGRTFQNLALFRSMNVLQNVELGAHARGRSGFLANALGLAAARREDAALRAEAVKALGLVGIEHLAARTVGSLPFGTQKRVELARALVGAPRLLLLDEPAAGLNHEEVGALGALVRRLRDALGVTVLLVEHHMRFVMGACDKVVALDFGKVIADGTPEEVQADPAVTAAYLGQAR